MVIFVQRGVSLICVLASIPSPLDLPMKDLAVLMPVYNDQEAMLQALDAIEETKNEFTVFVVDDGSTEKLELDEARYPFRVILVERELNEGLPRVLNYGLDLIREKGFRYLARLDAGDLQKKNRLTKQYQRFQEDEDLVLLGSNATFVDEATEKPLFVTNLPSDWASLKKWTVFRSCFIHPTVMMRLDRLDPDCRYESRYRHIEDYVLFTKICSRYPSAVMPEALVDCLVRESGISRSSDRAQLMMGVRHHLRNPRPFNPLWYAYLAKRFAFLATPYAWRQLPKRWLNLVRRPEEVPA